MGMEQRLYELRIESGYSQKRFAKEVGISINTYSKAEQGQQELSPRQITLICNRFLINREYLQEGVGPKYILDPKTIKAVTLFNKLSPKAQDFLICFLESVQEAQEPMKNEKED